MACNDCASARFLLFLSLMMIVFISSDLVTQSDAARKLSNEFGEMKSLPAETEVGVVQEKKEKAATVNELGEMKNLPPFPFPFPFPFPSPADMPFATPLPDLPFPQFPPFPFPPPFDIPYNAPLPPFPSTFPFPPFTFPPNPFLFPPPPL